MTDFLRPLWRMAACLAAMTLIAFAARADYETGQNAWDAGRHAEAVTAWQEAAQADDARAMLALGRAFVRGLGVPQDYVEAHKWLNLAAGLGNADAAAERDALAAEMTADERAEARMLARTWRTDQTRETAGAEPQEPPQAPADPPSSVDTPPERALREAQDLLATLGYAPGPADGKWGRRSIEAYRNFLSDIGMEAADMLTPEALRTMRRMARDTGSVAETGAPPRDALHRAVQAGDRNALATVLGTGASVDGLDGRGWTALMHAANLGQVLLVSPLLEAGADPDLRAPDGATALFMATAHGHSEIIAQLMEAGADISVPGPGGRTAVDVARARYGDVDTAREGGESLGVQALVGGVSIAEAEELARLVVGTTFRDCDACPEMVVVPAGSFVMGSHASEEDRGSGEEPQREVTISQPFAVGKFEVTFAEWDACVAAGGCKGYRPDDEGWGRGQRPVINVTWRDVKRYVAWLSQETGKRYRLLTEAEWEYAARAGTRTAYHWDVSVGRNRANCNGCGSRWDDDRTAPVGSFSANGFGLHDTSGNVSEWVEDCWHGNYAGAPSDGSASRAGWEAVPPGQMKICRLRVVRGGSWNFIPSFLRSASRDNRDPVNPSYHVGFRVARTLAP